MTPFFVVCIGRSGSMWLSRLLDTADGWSVAHEEKDPRNKVVPQPWTPFPVERFAPCYGEVNGMLRYHLSAQCLGREMEIPRRVYLRRDPLDIVASWMTTGHRAESELSATCHEVLWHSVNLAGWAALSQSRVVEAEDLWASREATQMLAEWLMPSSGIVVLEEMMSRANGGDRRAREAWSWTPERLSVARCAAERVGYADPISQNFLGKA